MGLPTRLADQIGETLKLFPGQMLCETPGHGVSIALTLAAGRGCPHLSASLRISLSSSDRRSFLPQELEPGRQRPGFFVRALRPLIFPLFTTPTNGARVIIFET